jgi:anti-sigma factor RsiW
MTHAPDATELYAGFDPEFVLIMAYIDGELSDTDREQFETRLASDPAFHKKAMPLMAVLALPIDVTDHLRVARAEIEQQEKQVTGGAGDIGNTGDAGGVRPISSAPRTSGLRRRVTSSYVRRHWISLAAAGIACIIVGVAQGTNAPQFLIQQDLRAADYRTAANETKDVDLPDGSHAIMSPGSGVHYDMHILKDQMVLDIDGEVRIDVAEGVKPVQVRKFTGYAELQAGGVYAVSSPDSSTKLLVTVLKGDAVMTNASGSQRVAVTSGNAGQLMGDGAVHVFAAIPTPPDRRDQ